MLPSDAPDQHDAAASPSRAVQVASSAGGTGPHTAEQQCIAIAELRAAAQAWLLSAVGATFAAGREQASRQPTPYCLSVATGLLLYVLLLLGFVW